MIVLFDLITPQSKIGGAGEYIRKVFYTLLNEITTRQLDCHLWGVVDSSLGKFAYPDLHPSSLNSCVERIIDINNRPLSQLVIQNKIDKVFIGSAQYWGGRYDLDKLRCEVICVIHDLCDEEYESAHLIEYFNLSKGLGELLRYKINHFLHKDRYNRMQPVINLINNNTVTKVVTVSNYSKNALVYFYGIKEERIEVLYSPERMVRKRSDKIENEVLANIINNKRRYYLLVSADRVNKNAVKALKAHQRYVEISGKDSLIVTTGVSDANYNHQIALPYLSESDLELAYSKCYAVVFPSYFEGFGYPPIEAMKYGKPVIASNVTSIPEVCREGAIYFSPLYETDIYRAFNELDKDYTGYSINASQRYMTIRSVQERDLMKLINIIL